MRKILFLFALLIFPIQAKALTHAQIKTELRLRIKDTLSTRQRYTDAQLTNLINEAHRDIVNKTHPLYNLTQVAVSTGANSASTPTDLLEYYRVLYTTNTSSDSGYVLTETSLYQLDSLNNGNNWIRTHGAPTNYYQDPTAPDKIIFFPIPSTTTQTGNLFIWYVQKANTLASDSDTPFQGINRYQDYSDLLVYYPAAIIYQIEGEGDKATAYMTLYADRLAELKNYVFTHPNFIPGFSGQRR